MDLKRMMGVRGSGQDSEARRERAANAAKMQQQLEAMMPTGPWGNFMTPEEIRVAGCVEPGNKLLKLVHDTIRRRHMAVLVELYAWQPGGDEDALKIAAGRVKELVELGQTIEEIVASASAGVK